ncbi:type 1 fimbrial protein [Aeromonas caviae]|uniref:type 1 fimbrial protein n=1 Tax=Aeromonas caviae TaxID=648 RepID=UPI002B471481|nr:type 1 fimbrial protein [Aeromonas caviae]
MKPIVVALTFASLGMSVAQAGPATSTGHITVSGAIVEDACHIEQQQERVQVTCLSGPQQTTETLNLRQLAKQSSQRLATSQVSYRWIDSRQTMAIITISHE